MDHQLRNRNHVQSNPDHAREGKHVAPSSLRWRNLGPEGGGFAGRARDGVQTASNAGDIVTRIEPLAKAAWQAAQEAGAV